MQSLSASREEEAARECLGCYSILEQNIATMQKAIKILRSLPAKKKAVKIELPKTGRHMISAAGRKRIAAAQTARWAEIRAGKTK
jgi:hypothetical protein